MCLHEMCVLFKDYQQWLLNVIYLTTSGLCKISSNCSQIASYLLKIHCLCTSRGARNVLFQMLNEIRIEKTLEKKNSCQLKAKTVNNNSRLHLNFIEIWLVDHLSGISYPGSKQTRRTSQGAQALTAIEYDAYVKLKN